MWRGPQKYLSVVPRPLSAHSPLCCPVANCLPAPLSSQLSFASPYHFWIRRDFRSKNPLSGFAPKQTKESSSRRATHIVLHKELRKLHAPHGRWQSILKAGDHSRGWPEGSLFDSYYTKVLGRALLLSLGCPTLPLIRTLQCWVLSKEASSTIFWVFGMTRPGIELRSPGPLANTLTARPILRKK